MKLAARAVEGFLRRPDPAVRLVLLYGPDDGLVRERALALTKSVVEDPRDPFRVAELTGAQIKADPARLNDEAAALAFGGGRRVVRLRDAGKEVAGALEAFLAALPGDALVVVEAGDLPTRDPLVRMVEQAAAGAAIGCYQDQAEGVDALIDAILGKAGVTLAPEAREWVVTALGADRLATRGELEKLALFAGAGGRIELADAIRLIGDSGALSLEDIAFAAGDGDLEALVRALDRARADGESPVAILRVAQRHFERLHRARAWVAAGASPEDAMRRLKPPVFFRRTGAFRNQLRRWPSAWLDAAVDRLLRTEIEVKSTGSPAEALVSRALIEMARAIARVR